MADPLAAWMLEQEARALMTRLSRVKPFALQETMLPAAAVSPAAQARIDRFLVLGRRELRERIRNFIQSLKEPGGADAPPEEMQRAFTSLRMRFNDVLSQFDLFADVLSQRSENETGVWLAGLDVVATDALALPGGFYEPPPLICYLDRGPGAAVRRARTRLPGGGENPVAIIRVPRERMIGTGIASSLVHEVGHQGAALLNLVESLRPVLKERQGRAGQGENVAWGFWERWISEIVADLWSVSRVGIAATLGLIGVVSLPRFFVFRINKDDPHPAPWIRVKLSAAMGDALYPHPQWSRLAELWEAFYPLDGLDDERRVLVRKLEESLPAFVTVLLDHRPEALRGASLSQVLGSPDRRPDRLMDKHRLWRAHPERARLASPTFTFAVIGQARASGAITAQDEGNLLAELLTLWALRRALRVTRVFRSEKVADLRCLSKQKAPSSAMPN